MAECWSRCTRWFCSWSPGAGGQAPRPSSQTAPASSLSSGKTMSQKPFRLEPKKTRIDQVYSVNFSKKPLRPSHFNKAQWFLFSYVWTLNLICKKKRVKCEDASDATVGLTKFRFKGDSHLPISCQATSWYLIKMIRVCTFFVPVFWGRGSLSPSFRCLYLPRPRILDDLRLWVFMLVMHCVFLFSCLWCLNKA